MADRNEIAAAVAERHAIPHLAHKLVGATAAELEADAAARAALIQMFQPSAFKQADHARIIHAVHGGGDDEDA